MGGDNPEIPALAHACFRSGPFATWPLGLVVASRSSLAVKVIKSAELAGRNSMYVCRPASSPPPGLPNTAGWPVLAV